MGAENEGGDAEGGFALGGLFQFGARQQRGVGGAHGVRRIDGTSWVEDGVLSDSYRTGSSTRVETKVSVVVIARTRKRWHPPLPRSGNGSARPGLVGASVGMLDESGCARIAEAMRFGGLMKPPCAADEASIKQSKPARSRNIRLEMQIGDPARLKTPVRMQFGAWALIGF